MYNSAIIVEEGLEFIQFNGAVIHTNGKIIVSCSVVSIAQPVIRIRRGGIILQGTVESGNRARPRRLLQVSRTLAEASGGGRARQRSRERRNSGAGKGGSGGYGGQRHGSRRAYRRRDRRGD